MKVEVFCCRIERPFGGSFGFGLSPEEAFSKALAEANISLSTLKSEVKKKKAHINMKRLPDGVVNVEVDGMGSLNWEGGPAGITSLPSYDMNSQGKWVERK